MSEPMTVYVVMEGPEYERRVVCVFSNAEQAETFAERRNRNAWYGGTYEVESFELDALVPELSSGKTAFLINWTNDPGRSSYPWWTGEDYTHKELPFIDVRRRDYKGYGHWETWVWADSREDALRNGAERIMPVLAAEGISDVRHPDLTPQR